MADSYPSPNGDVRDTQETTWKQSDVTCVTLTKYVETIHRKGTATMSENTVSADLVAIDPAALAKEITSLSTGETGVFSTIQGNDFEAKLAVLNAVSDSEPIADNLNKTINVRDVVIQAVEMTDERTGELRSVPRVVLIDDKGKSYHAISGPLFRDVKNWFGIMGMPHTWDSPIKVTVSRKGTGNSQYFSAKVTK